MSSLSMVAIPGARELVARFAARQAKIGVVGMGYVGLPLALLLSDEQFSVTGFDIDSQKVQALNNGGSYIARILPEEIASARARGFQATADYSAIREMDAIVICVPTPLNEYQEPDLSYVIGTAESIAPHLRAGQLIVLESTTYPGTTEEVLVTILENNNLLALKAARNETSCAASAGQCNGPAGEAGVFYVAFSPEREDPGRSDISRREIPKVVGGLDSEAGELAAALYGSVFRHIVRVSTPSVAEMCKLLENIYRCVNIALVNELKLVCDRMGINLWEVIEAAKTKPFGFQAFYPGPGLGGHCIPVDPFYLSWRAKKFDFHTRFIELAGEVNRAMPYHVVEAVARALNTRHKALNGAKILVLGVAYKKDVDDLRESPALTILELLQNQGAMVCYNDPYFPFIGRGRHYNLQMHCTALNDLAQYDCVLIVTDHSDYDYRRIVRESQLVVDTRNATRGIAAANLVHA